ncbi:Eukaryotic translation initiation factor 4E transporter [Heterocephalus glaber]|uniref:Eukaryotic translation initiation factor 4E transporter n=1 Tax=Heterocephalus glaber TaxID=10181 RepID=G5BU12_HETGA|nr:Eukaryotic translation initiation factor 4E transporter [Heterocephalus glaber]
MDRRSVGETENGDAFLDLKKLLASKSPHRYTKEELLDIKERPHSKQRPPCLSEKYDSDGVWNPEKWHASLYPSSGWSSPVESLKKELDTDRPSLVLKIVDPRERVKEDDLDVVLSPQRRSFGGGCHVTAAVSSHRSGSPLEEDNDGLRLLGGRRVGSGRIISARNFEKDHRLSDKVLRDLRERDRETDYKDKRFRREFGDSKRVFGERRRNDSYTEEEPEWFSAGPTSQSETIELTGFDDKILEEDHKGRKRTRRRTSSVKEDPRERVKEDDLDVVLSPQRRSFGGGCHVTAAVSSHRSGSPLEEDNDGLRLLGGRRVGSGRIISARNFEKDHRLSDKVLRDLRERDRETDYKDKRFRREFGDSKRVFGERRRNDSYTEEEPEWFSAGPTSQSETIELTGFDDKILEEDHKGRKRTRRRTSSVKEGLVQRMLAQGVHPRHLPSLLQAGVLPPGMDLTHLQGISGPLLGQPFYPLPAASHPLLNPRPGTPLHLAMMQQQLQRSVLHPPGSGSQPPAVSIQTTPQNVPSHPGLPHMRSQLEHHPSYRSSSPVGLAKWFGSDVLQQPLPSMPAKVISVDELEYQQ